VLAGEWTRAAELAAEGLELAEELDADHSRAALLYVAAQVDALLGRLDDARTRATRGVELARKSRSDVYEWLNGCVLGFVDLSIGNHSAAIAVLEPMLGLRIASTPGGQTRLPVLIDALIGAGHLERAHECVDVLEEAARRLHRPSAQAATARCRGSLLAAENDLPRALLAFDDALQVLAGVDIPFEQARTHLALGQVQRRARRRQEARRSLQAALTTFERLGASVWADQARRELGRIGGRAPSADVLTSTEEQVAVLVAEGLTNREAAASLHLSEHTVEGHLSRIYAKLGIRSRSELARHLVRDDRGQAHR
jgi:DNA-binding CsgD family transcriptional regulator